MRLESTMTSARRLSSQCFRKCASFREGSNTKHIRVNKHPILTRTLTDRNRIRTAFRLLVILVDYVTTCMDRIWECLEFLGTQTAAPGGVKVLECWNRTMEGRVLIWWEFLLWHISVLVRDIWLVCRSIRMSHIWHTSSRTVNKRTCSHSPSLIRNLSRRSDFAWSRSCKFKRLRNSSAG